MAEFVCGVREKNPDYLSACKNLPEYQETSYCVLHFPGEQKREDFEQVKQSKLEQEDYDFRGTIFPAGTSDFSRFVFDGNADFTRATFIGEADFSFAQFSGEVTLFSEAQFSGERTYFSRAQFSGEVTYFSEAQFSGKETDFSRAQFNSGESTLFSEAQFSGEVTYFSRAQFSGERTDFTRAQFNSGKWTSFGDAKFNSGEWTSFGDAKFSGESTYFSGAQFSGKETDFSEAQFSSGERTDFSYAHFRSEMTTFRGAHFSGNRTYFKQRAHFSSKRTDFSYAHFGSERTTFSESCFSGKLTTFRGARFRSERTSFRETTFTEKVDFSRAIFRERVPFWGTTDNRIFGSQAWAWFDLSRIEKPELLEFNTVSLHPGWFINADVRKVNFTNVTWYGMLGAKGTLDRELSVLEEHLEEHKVKARHRLLAQACRRLSANAEENREYPLANDFHYWSMDATRKGDWSFFKDLTWRDLLKRESWPSIARYFSLITTLYWALSGYGVRAVRAFWVLVGMCATFAVLYMLLGPPKLEDLGQALVYSLGAVARLNPEPRPTEPGLFQFLVIVEGLLGPLQIALLALAVRRKVMR